MEAGTAQGGPTPMRWYVCDECHQQWPSDELSALQVIQHEDETGHHVYIAALTAAVEPE